VRRLELTKFRVGNFVKNDKRSDLKKKIEEFDLLNRFNNCGIGKRIVKQQKRANLTDFDRFKVLILKRKLAKSVRTYVNKNRKAILSKAK